MNEQNFDKIFGDKLNEGIDFNFTEQKWGKMEKHLDAFQAEKGRKRLVAWVLMPLLALMGLLTWGGWLLYDAQKHILELTQEVHNLTIEKQILVPPSVFSIKNDFKNDTVYHHIVVKRYDTIFQTVVQNVVGKFISRSDSTITTSTAHLTSLKDVESGDIQLTKKQATSSDSLKTGASHFQSLQDLESVSTTQKDSTKTIFSEPLNEKDHKKNDSLTTSPPLSIKGENDEEAVKNAKKDYKNEDKPFENDENSEKALVKQKRSPILKPIKIAGYELGILGGVASMARPNIIRQNGFAVGARVGALLGERWKIVGETQYLFLSYETSKITPDLDIKIITPPTPNDSLDGVKVKQPYWQYALGLQYVLSNTRFKPYLGINLLGQHKLKEEFEYEYFNKLTNTPTFVQTSRKEKLFQMPFVRLQLGASYPLFGKIEAQIEGSYDVKFDNTPQYKPLWQVKTGLLYRF